MKPIAIFGGTFDPVHLGHLRAAWEAAEYLDAEVRMMPARVPPHRPPTRASAEQRVALLRAALEGQDRLRMDTRELDREGPSYSVDTLLDLRAEFGSTQPLVLLVGADAFAGLDRWDRWRQLFQLAHIGVLTRPGVRADGSETLREAVRARRTDRREEIHASAHGRVIDVPVTALDISASAVRAQLAAGREPRYLLPQALLRDPALLNVYRD
ncbi:nicotinate-nucleotide adenylyltransferase [Oleiagrimonas soli]|uniref:Probable nicotinate-nucleotide adenylyltransferase n=1 Tax=Oleiagrimonas soli TaxID=1543381 RepID=A0A099CV02_9GAMM|nr:nicotinate-nucleotide adenylyltransferase [Oleiagrimonas soli]KGI77783.1 nicotinate-nucleotide adenylyltransferase [Oleiagrimonas soli]MBB6183893.1 nicotinate-nucleotide adenylyltransferase [Oleiagrimonas soli]